MNVIECSELTLVRYSVNDAISQAKDRSVDYQIVQVRNLDVSLIEDLKKQGYQFHDRILQMEIDIASTIDMRNSKMKKLIPFSLEVSNQISEEMYLLGCIAFNTDRRFHLKQEFDNEIAKKVLREYINYYNKKDILTTQVTYNGELAGYMVINQRDGQAENVLGATKPGILGKMVAYGMYANTIEYLCSQENYKKYYAEVSSTNINSINLHIQLGAKVVGIYDEYIYRNN